MKTRRLATAAAAATLLWGCDATEPARPGVLTASLTGARPGDAALVLAISGPAVPSDVAAEGGYQVHSRTQAGVTSVAVFGDLREGPMVRFTIPDAKLASRFTVQVREVADEEYSLRESLAGYGVKVERDETK